MSKSSLCLRARVMSAEAEGKIGGSTRKGERRLERRPVKDKMCVWLWMSRRPNTERRDVSMRQKEMSTQARTTATSMSTSTPSIPTYLPFISHSQRPVEGKGSGLDIVATGPCEQNSVASECASFRRGYGGQSSGRTQKLPEIFIFRCCR